MSLYGSDDDIDMGDGDDAWTAPKEAIKIQEPQKPHLKVAM